VRELVRVAPQAAVAACLARAAASAVNATACCLQRGPERRRRLQAGDEAGAAGDERLFAQMIRRIERLAWHPT